MNSLASEFGGITIGTPVSFQNSDSERDCARPREADHCNSRFVCRSGPLEHGSA